MKKEDRKGGRPRTWDESILPEIAERYPNENTKDLAQKLGIPYGSLKWLANKYKWRKTGKFKRQLGIESQAKDTVPPELRQMAGAERRDIHSGMLLKKGNKIVHLAK